MPAGGYAVCETRAGRVLRRGLAWQQQRQHAGREDEPRRCPQAGGQSVPLVEQTREDGPGEAPAGVGHVVEADVHRRPCRCRSRRGSGRSGRRSSSRRRRRRRSARRRSRSSDRRPPSEPTAIAAGTHRQHEGEPRRGPAVGLAARAVPRRRTKRGRGRLHDPVADHPDREEVPDLPEAPAEDGLEEDRAGRPRTRRRARRRGRSAPPRAR